MEAGDGVDVVLDLTEDFDVVSEKLGGKRFKTVICLSVLEHCRDPFRMCRNMSRLLEKDGILLVSAPFAWRIHGYPSDYWRFTPEGIRLLFPEVEFDAHTSNICTNKPDESRPIDRHMLRVELSPLKGIGRKRYGLCAGMFLSFCRKLRIFPSIFRYRYLFPPVMINMRGRKK